MELGAENALVWRRLQILGPTSIPQQKNKQTYDKPISFFKYFSMVKKNQR